MAIKKSTHYALVVHGVVIAKGNKKTIERLKKKVGGKIWNAPASRVGWVENKAGGLAKANPCTPEKRARAVMAKMAPAVINPKKKKRRKVIPAAHRFARRRPKVEYDRTTRRWVMWAPSPTARAAPTYARGSGYIAVGEHTTKAKAEADAKEFLKTQPLGYDPNMIFVGHDLVRVGDRVQNKKTGDKGIVYDILPGGRLNVAVDAGWGMVDKTTAWKKIRRSPKKKNPRGKTLYVVRGVQKHGSKAGLYTGADRLTHELAEAAQYNSKKQADKLKRHLARRFSGFTWTTIKSTTYG